jgi:hypothetical protein
MEIKSLGLRFLTSNAYFNCNEYELANQYSIDFQRIFFPHYFSKIANFSYEGSPPLAEFFLSSLDSPKLRQEKLFFIRNLKSTKYVWNFQKELIQFSEQKLFLLTLSCLKFVSDCLDFQFSIKNSTNIFKV